MKHITLGKPLGPWEDLRKGMDLHILSEATSILSTIMLEDALLGSQVRMSNPQTGVA